MDSKEDEYWSQSSVRLPNFFDDDQDLCLSSTEIFTAAIQETSTLPIHSIISNQCLKIVLDDTDATVESANSPPEETIKWMFYGDNCILYSYKSLESKLQLLEAALEIGDGDVILTVILFMRRTLNNCLFYSQMSNHKVALRHYANYLIERNSLQELADLYMATGNLFHMKSVYYLIGKSSQSASTLHKKLSQFNLQHAGNSFSNDDKHEISDHLAFLELQIPRNSYHKSIVEHLINLCKSEFNKSHGDELINQFKKKFKLDDFQFEWVIMSALCAMQSWDSLLSYFIKSAWVVKKPTLKSVARPEVLILGIGRHNPPEHILEQLLSAVTDTEKVLYLAEKLKMHMYVVSYHVEQKDKISLLKYMEKVPLETSAMSAIQSSLNNPEIKWKN